MNKFSLIFGLLVFANVSPVSASEHTEKMCEKIRECALGELATNQIPEQMRDIMVQVINTQCDSMAEKYDAQFEEAGVREKAEACVDSIVVQSCSDLMATKGRPNTVECEEFEQAANDAGIETK